MEHFEISVQEKELKEYPENLQITENNISNNNGSILLKRKRQSRTFTTLKYLKSNTLHDQSIHQLKPTSHQSTHWLTPDQSIHWLIHQSRLLDHQSNPLSSFTPVYLYNSILQTLLNLGNNIQLNPSQFNKASMSSYGWNTPTL